MTSTTRLLLILVLCTVGFATFVPIGIHYDGASLEARDEQKRDCFKPTSTVDLHYIEEYNNGEPYVISVTPSHSDSVYVHTEKFEHLLSDLSCESFDHERHVNIVYTFDTAQSMQLAQESWVQGELLFITHHVSCNPSYERRIYRAERIRYDFENLVVVITARYLVLGDSPEAHTHIKLAGGPVPSELEHKLRRRAGIVGIEKRDRESSSWVIPLDQKWDQREDIITFQDYGLACVGCSLTGEVTASFVLDVEISDVLDFDSPFNEATIKLETTKSVDGDFNIELAAAVKAHVECAIPGTGCSGAYRTLGKKFEPGAPRKGFTLGSWTITASLSLGLTLALQAEAKAKLNVPFTIDSPKGSAAWKNFFGEGGNTLDLAPKFGTPVIHKEDIEAKVCAAVSIGPAVALTLDHTLGSATIGARLDLPRISICAELEQNVNDDCDSGNIDEAIKLTGDLGVGLAAFGKIEIGPIPVAGFNTEAGDLYKKWSLFDKCYDIDGNDGEENTGNNQPPSVSPNSTTTTPPTTGNQNTTVPDPEDTSYDCSAVAPSPGGQPCGNVGMLCPSAYTWSCGKGQEGGVPPGTFCACGAFRYPGWQPPTASEPPCTEGIYCVSETTFSVCSPAGLEPPQSVAQGTVCRDGVILATRRYSRM